MKERQGRHPVKVTYVAPLSSTASLPKSPRRKVRLACTVVKDHLLHSVVSSVRAPRCRRACSRIISKDISLDVPWLSPCLGRLGFCMLYLSRLAPVIPEGMKGENQPVLIG